MVPLAAPGFLAELSGSRGEDPDKNPTVLVVVHCKVRISTFTIIRVLPAIGPWTSSYILRHSMFAAVQQSLHDKTFHTQGRLSTSTSTCTHTRSEGRGKTPTNCDAAPSLQQQAYYICHTCGKVCHSRIGLFSPQWVHLD